MKDVPRHAWRALFAAQLGWMLDAMDFLLFTFALLTIQAEFGLTKQQISLPIVTALVASAIGGIAFGRIADRVGRVRAMTFSILLYSGATAGMATAQNLWQLIAWRVLVGFGMGGEWSCGSVLVAETWPAKHRAKAMGLMQSGWAIGALIAAALSALVLERFGWRVLFLIGAAPAVLAFYVRRNVEEPEVWRERDATQSRFTDIFAPQFRKRVALATLVASSVLVAYWGVTSWLPAFLATPVEQGGAGLTVTKSAAWLIVLQLGAFLGYISFGWIADKIGRRPAFTFFMIAATLVGYFAHGYFSLFGAMLAELFPTRIRASAQGFCYNSGRLVSALAPYAIGAAATKHGLGFALAADAVFFALGAVLIWLLPETRGTEL
jgi:MFS family permease